MNAYSDDTPWMRWAGTGWDDIDQDICIAVELVFFGPAWMVPAGSIQCLITTKSELGSRRAKGAWGPYSGGTGEYQVRCRRGILLWEGSLEACLLMRQTDIPPKIQLVGPSPGTVLFFDFPNASSGENPRLHLQILIFKHARPRHLTNHFV